MHAAPRLHNRAGRIPSASLEEHEASLLGVARALFYEHGFEGTSIEGIARAAHVSPKTIYSRFTSKHGLFIASIRPRADELLASLATPLVSDSDIRVALVDFAIRLLTTTTTPEALLIQRLVIAESARFPDLGIAFYDAGPKRGIAVLAAFLARATATGHIRISDPKTMAELFIGALLGVPVRAAMIVHSRLSRKAIIRRADDVVALFIAAFGSPQ